MKATKSLRGRVGDHGSEDVLRKASKLDPIRKSGKEKYALYSMLEEDEELDWKQTQRESILDYFDDEASEDDEDDVDEDDDWEEDPEDDYPA